MTQTLAAKPLRSLTRDEIVFCHLSRWRESTSDYTVTSSIEQIETEMRQSRGTRLTASYVPLLAAFAILDQIGTTYADLALPPHPNKGSGIHRALYYFGGYAAMSPEVQALYALRNGLVHDASLTCHVPKTGEWFIFRYDLSMPDAIRMASTPWDGQAINLGPATTTLINPRVLTDQVSEMLTALRDCHCDRPSSLQVLKSGPDILHKYLFWEP